MPRGKIFALVGTEPLPVPGRSEWDRWSQTWKEGASQTIRAADQPPSLAHLKTPFPHPPSWMFPSASGSTAPPPPLLGWRATLMPTNHGCPPGPS